MNIRYFLFTITLVFFAQPNQLKAADSEGLWGTDGRAEISNVRAFLREVDRAMSMAGEGEYGEISDSDMYRLEEAGRTIRGVLAGRSSVNGLDRSQVEVVTNAREAIGSVLRIAEKDREICLPAMITGSRIARPECLTLKEREDRAYYERERRWPPI